MSLYMYGWMNAASIRRQKVKSSQNTKNKTKQNRMKKKLSLSRRLSQKLFFSLVGWVVFAKAK